MIVNSVLLYIDPGTGSLLVSLVVGFVISIIYSVKGLFYKALNLFFGANKNAISDFSGKSFSLVKVNRIGGYTNRSFQSLLIKTKNLFTCLLMKKMKDYY